MKTLVTGASGFIGRHLVKEDNVALVRRPSGFSEEIIADILDKHSLESCCDGIDLIIHCAGFARETGKNFERLHWQINFEGTKNILDVAQTAGVKKFIYLSTVKAMAKPGENCANEDWPGKPESHYGQAKLAAEQAVLEAGISSSMKATVLRPAMVYGAGGYSSLERLAKGIQMGWFPILPDTGNLRSFLNIDDLVNAIWLAAERSEANGKTYIVAYPKPHSGREVCELVRSMTPKKVISWNVSEKSLRNIGKIGDMLSSLFHRKLPINSHVVSRLLDSEHYTPARIQRELGWQPKVDLKKGLQKLLNS